MPHASDKHLNEIYLSFIVVDIPCTICYKAFLPRSGLTRLLKTSTHHSISIEDSMGSLMLHYDYNFYYIVKEEPWKKRKSVHGLEHILYWHIQWTCSLEVHLQSNGSKCYWLFFKGSLLQILPLIYDKDKETKIKECIWTAQVMKSKVCSVENP